MAHQLLLADRSPTIQRVIKLTFAGEDIGVVTVGDGEQALAAIDRQPPDIVLADVAMPGRSGYEVAEHIRSSPGLSHIPVLLLNAAFEPIDQARVDALGCDGVLSKPFAPEVVVSRVKELLAKPRPAVRPSPASDRSERPSAAGPRSRSPEVDAYFERLDQAFAALAAAPRPAPSRDLSSPAGGSEELKGPAPTPTTDAGAALLTEPQIQLIVDRVLGALAERLGVPVADVVATVAERLVREEIAEIKRRV